MTHVTVLPGDNPTSRSEDPPKPRWLSEVERARIEAAVEASGTRASDVKPRADVFVRPPPRPTQEDLTREIFNIRNNHVRGALIDTIGAKAGVTTPPDPSLLGKMAPEKIDVRAAQITRSLVEQAVVQKRDLLVNGRDLLTGEEKTAIRDPKTRTTAAADAGERIARREALADAAGGRENLEKIEDEWRRATPEERAKMREEGQKLADERSHAKSTAADVALLITGAPDMLLLAKEAGKGVVHLGKGAVGYLSRRKPPQTAWTPELSHATYLKAAPKDAAQEIAKLSPQELRAIYPEGGAIPNALHDVAKVPGFASFAKANPAQARTLADANASFADFPKVVTQNVDRAVDQARTTAGRRLTAAEEQAARDRGFLDAARAGEAQMPKVVTHAADPRYTVATRRPDAPGWQPQVELAPKSVLDHNGAFAQPASMAGKTGVQPVKSLVQARTPILPEQLVVNGKPLPNMDGVLTFGGHGSRAGFQNLSTKEAATMVADQIATSSVKGKVLDKVVLDACHQRDKRWFFGGSNAQAFERELNKQLSERGLPRVQVLAAERGGPTYGSHQRSWTGNPASSKPTSYTPASDGARFYLTREEALIGVAGVGAAGVVPGGHVIYRAITDR